MRAVFLLIFNVCWSFWFFILFLPVHRSFYLDNPDLMVHIPLDPVLFYMPLPKQKSFQEIKYVVPSNLILWVCVQNSTCNQKFCNIFYEFLFMWFCYNVFLTIKACTMSLLPLPEPSDSHPLYEYLPMDFFFLGHISPVCIIFMHYVYTMKRSISFQSLAVSEVYIYCFALLYSLCSILHLGVLLVTAGFQYSIDIFLAPFLMYCVFQFVRPLFYLLVKSPSC